MELPTQRKGPAGWRTVPKPATPATALPVDARRRARGRRLFWLLLAVWIINLFDLGLTLLAYQQNLMVELNPLAAKVLPHGTAALVAYKLGLLGLGTVALWYCRHHWVTEPAVWGYVVVCVCLSFWWHKLMIDIHHSWADIASPARALAEPPPPPRNL